MAGFGNFNSAAAKQEQEDADDMALALRRQIQKRIEALSGQIRARGVRGEFALAGARHAASDLDLGEAVGGMVVSLCLWGPVAMMFGADSASSFFFGDDQNGGFSWGGLTEGLGFLVDAEIDSPVAGRSRTKASSYYPEGRRQCRISAMQDLFNRFNSAANRSMRLGGMSEAGLRAEMRYMKTLMEALGRLQREGDKEPRYTEETIFEAPRARKVAQNI